MPALHDNVRVLFLGREAPVAAWHVSPGWQGLFQSIRLGPLDEQEARDLLMQAGISPADAPRINRFARGHPLACKLAAAAVVGRTTRSLLGAMLPDAAPQDAYERLLALPFIEHASDGLIVHDAVQQAIATALHAADPSKHRALCRAAWHAFAGARELAIGLFHAANGVRLAVDDLIERFRRARAAARNHGSHVSR